jgi:hypothetical protein
MQRSIQRVFDFSMLSSFCDRGHEASSQTAKALPRPHARTGTASPPVRGAGDVPLVGHHAAARRRGGTRRLVFTRLLERGGPLPLARPHSASPIPRRLSARGMVKRP